MKNNKNFICKLIDKSKVVSFDLFDTLLYRPYFLPQDLFLHLENIYKQEGFYNLRKNAENEFYSINGFQKEATINDIYNVLPSKFQYLKDKEIELELSCLKINIEIKEIYNYALKTNKIIVITSDMYLPYSCIEAILKKHNIKYDKLYLSNKIGKRKDTGKLYEHIIQDLKISPKDILHIGDNKYSDYIQARKHGIKAFLYLPKFKTFKDKRIIKLHKINKENITSSIITKLIIDNSYKYSDFWTSFGYKFAGPLAFQYTSWIYNKTILDNIDTIFFIARDGYIIKKIFDLINTAKIKNYYVYAPRIVNYISLLGFNQNTKEQADVVCKYFNIDTKGKDSIAYINENINLIKNLCVVEKNKIKYNDYINSFISNNTKKIGVVDTISGQLSAQRLIEKETNINTTGFYITTLNNKYKINKKHYSFIEKNLREPILKNNIANLIELVFSSPENPIIKINNGEQIYQENIKKEEKYRQETFCKIEQGVLAFIKDLLSTFKYEQLCFDNDICIKNLLCFIKNLSRKELRSISKVYQSPFADNSIYVPLLYSGIRLKGKDFFLPNWQCRLICLVISIINIKYKDNKINLYLLSFLSKKFFSISVFNKINVIIGKK